MDKSLLRENSFPIFCFCKASSNKIIIKLFIFIIVRNNEIRSKAINKKTFKRIKENNGNKKTTDFNLKIYIPNTQGPQKLSSKTNRSVSEGVSL